MPNNKMTTTHQAKEVRQQTPTNKEVVELTFETMESISGGAALPHNGSW